MVELSNNSDALVVHHIDGTKTTVRGSGITGDADLLDEIREREKLNYGVFRKPNSK
jgi:hypothetical protein